MPSVSRPTEKPRQEGLSPTCSARDRKERIPVMGIRAVPWLWAWDPPGPKSESFRGASDAESRIIQASIPGSPWSGIGLTESSETIRSIGLKKQTLENNNSLKRQDSENIL